MKDADSDIFNDALDGGGIEPSLDESIRESIRCSFVSSQSEQSLPDDPSRDQFVMSRLNWITSLKMLFDELESFNKQKQRHVELHNFLKALRKIKTLLPLLARNDYYRTSSDVAFSYREVEAGVMHMPKYITFDNVYDLFLSHKPVPVAQRAHQQPINDYSSQHLRTSMMLDENDESYISEADKIVVEQQEQIEETYHQYRTNHAQMKGSKASVLLSAAATNAYSSIQQERPQKSSLQLPPQNEIFVLSFAEGVLQMANSQGSWVENPGHQQILAAPKAPLMLNTNDDDEACEIDSEGGGDAMSSQGSETHDNRRRSNKNKLEESVRSSRTATFKSIRNASLHQQQMNVTQSSIHNTSQPSFHQTNQFQNQLQSQQPEYQDSYYYSQPVQSQQQIFQSKQPIQYIQQLPYQHHGQQASIGSRKELNESHDSETNRQHSRTSSQKYKESLIYDSAANNLAEKTRISSQNSGQKTTVTAGPLSNHNNTLLSQSSQSSSSYRQGSGGQPNLHSKISMLTSGTNSLSGLNQSNFIDLDLSQKGLTTFEMDFRQAYGDKKVLRSINLAQNGLMKLPINVEKSLQYLNMSYNKLKSLSGIEGCVNLKLLNVQGNYITSASNIVILQSMRELIFAHNQLTTTKDIAQLKNLNLLDLSTNKLVELDKIIPLQNLKKLNILSLYGNLIQKQMPNYDSTMKKMMPWVQVLDPDQIRDFTQFSLMENVCFTDPPLIQVEQQNSQHLLTQNPMILNREIFNTEEKQKERSKTPNKERTKSNQLGSFDNRLKSSAVSPHRRQTMDHQPSMFSQPLTSARLPNPSTKIPNTTTSSTQNKYNEQQFRMQGKVQLPQQLQQQKGNVTSRNAQQRSVLTAESRLDKSQNRDKSPQQTAKNIVQQNKSQVRDRSTSNISKNNPSVTTVKPQISTNAQLKGSAEKVMNKQPGIKKIAVNVNVANTTNKVQLASNILSNVPPTGKLTPKSGLNGNLTPRQEQVTHYYKKSFCQQQQTENGNDLINLTMDTPPSEQNTVDSSGKKPVKTILRKEDLSSLITLSPAQKKEMFQTMGVQQMNSRNQLGNRPATTLKQRANTSQTADYQVLNQTMLPQSTKNSAFSQSFAFERPGSSNIISSSSSRPSSQLQKFITASKTQQKTVIGGNGGVVQTPVVSQPCQKLTNLPPRAYQSRIEKPGDKKSKADMHSSILSQNTQTNQSTSHCQVVKTSMILQSCEDTMNDIDEENNMASRVSSGSLSPVGDESSNIKKLQVDLTQFMGSNKLQ